MVTNLPVQAKAKWAHVVACHSIPIKIKLMREFVSLVPKHKGTSKLLMNVRRRIVALEHEMEKEIARKKGGARRRRGFSFSKAGAGQIIILGPTNVGKSSLLELLTNAKPQISYLPYTTYKPTIGMFQYEDLQFQLIDPPSIAEGSSEGRMEGSRIFSLARNADGFILMVDLTHNPARQLTLLKSELEKSNIIFERAHGAVQIRRRSYGSGISIIGGRRLLDCAANDIRDLLESYRIDSATVRIRGSVRLEDVENALFSEIVYKPALVIANKDDLVESNLDLSNISEVIGDAVPIISYSCRTRRKVERIGESVFDMLKIVRVYTKAPPDKESSMKPVIIRKGSMVIDVSKKLHSRLYNNFKYARIWGASAKYPGQKVGSDHLLKDGDIVEIH